MPPHSGCWVVMEGILEEEGAAPGSKGSRGFGEDNEGIPGCQQALDTSINLYLWSQSASAVSWFVHWVLSASFRQPLLGSPCPPQSIRLRWESHGITLATCPLHRGWNQHSERGGAGGGWILSQPCPYFFGQFQKASQQHEVMSLLWASVSLLVK